MSVNSTNPAPVVASHGHFKGTVMGAEVILLADIAYQNLINSLEALSAQYATTLANAENTIQDQLSTLQQQAWASNHMTDVTNDINNNKVTKTDQAEMGAYTTALQFDTSEVQAATKSIDPVLTTEQNQPSALQQGANEFIQELGAVIQVWQAVANDRIG
jgi:hypothetical protein